MGLGTREIISQQLDQARFNASRQLEKSHQLTEIDSPGMEYEPPRPSWMGRRPGPLTEALQRMGRIIVNNLPFIV